MRSVPHRCSGSCAGSSLLDRGGVLWFGPERAEEELLQLWIDAERDRRMCLRIDVHHEHPRTVGGQTSRQIHGRGRLSTTALLVHDCDDTHAIVPPAYERLAVLPPTNLTNDPEHEYFVAGMHNALISELQKAGVPVIARTSVLQYENTQKPIREIANELHVDALVEASVFRYQMNSRKQ